MPAELVAVLGTLSGALLVGVINYFSNKGMKNHEWRLALARDQFTIRQKLYAELLVESHRLVIQAREEKISSLADLNAINGKYAEVCLVGTTAVIEDAEKLTGYAITSYSTQPASEIAEFYTLKRSFIAAARKDMAKVLSEA